MEYIICILAQHSPKKWNEELFVLMQTIFADNVYRDVVLDWHHNNHPWKGFREGG